MRKFASVIALLLVAAMALSMASCRSGGDGKDTTTSGSDTSSNNIPDSSSSDSDAPVVTPGPAESTTEPNANTTPEDTTTATPVTTAPTPVTTTTTPVEIKWTEANKTVYVSVENVWIRKSPDLDDSSRVEVLKLRDALTCTATSESWLKVTYGGETRYISASCVTEDDISGNIFEKANDKVYVTVSSAWLRIAPSTDTAEKSYALKGAELTRTAKSTDWSEVTVTVDGQTMTLYINNSCISTTKPQ